MQETRVIPVLGRSPEEGNGNPLQYSWLGNPMSRGVWQTTVHGLEKCQTQLSNSKTESLGDERRPSMKQIYHMLYITRLNLGKSHLPNSAWCLPTWFTPLCGGEKQKSRQGGKHQSLNFYSVSSFILGTFKSSLFVRTEVKHINTNLSVYSMAIHKRQSHD